jgi:epoxide hydrolase 4
MPPLMNDVVAVIRSLGREKAIIVGHDSGGRIAWNLALEKPQFVEKLIVVNLPHPYAQDRAKATIPEQQQRSPYAILNKAEGSEKSLTAESVSQRITDPEAKKKYLEAFQRPDFDFKNVMDYYRVKFPDEPYQMPQGEPKRLTVPLLMIHGLKDQVFVHAELNDTWDWVDKDMTLITLPDAGHFSQEEAPEFVTRSMVLWRSR